MEGEEGEELEELGEIVLRPEGRRARMEKEKRVDLIFCLVWASPLSVSFVLFHLAGYGEGEREAPQGQHGAGDAGRG